MENPKTTSLFSSTSKTSLTTIPAKDIEIGALIGQGGYGIVYQGSWQYTTVAVKKLHLQKLTEDLMVAFKQEATIMAQCQFPNIVQLWGVCLEPGHYSMVMEYMPKGSLYEVLHNSKETLPWSPVRWQIATDMSMGLTYLHDQGIIHRDLKSLNVLLDQQYHAKLADFGLAKLKLETSSTSTKQGPKTAGTVRWKAPELFKRGAKANEASDVYSCGMVLWEIASRQLPYSDASDEVTAMGWIKDGEKENIPDDCPKAYGQLVQACWAEIKERPTASDIVKALKDATPKPASKPKTSTSSHTRSWHYDANNPKLPQKKIENYTLVPATEQDIAKVIEAYQVRPVKGQVIKNVQLIYNPEMNRGFAARLTLLQNRQGKTAFAPQWHTESQATWRKQIHQQYLKLAQPHQDPNYPNVQLIPLWHGTKTSVLTSLYETGYANLAKTDVGYFGKGLYFTTEAEYAHRVYSDGSLILNWVASYSAYPVTRPDMQTLMGQANYQNYDAHFVPVVPANPNNPNEVSYYPCKNAQEPAVYHEMVVFDWAQALPRYQVELGPESIPLPLKPPIASKKTQPKAHAPLTITTPPSKLSLSPVTYQNTSEDLVKAATAMLRAREWQPQQIAYFEELIQTLSLPPVQTLVGNSYASKLIVAPNNLLATAAFNQIKVWDLNSGKPLWESTEHTTYIRTLVLMNDYQLASGSSEGVVKVWNLQNGGYPRTLKNDKAIGDDSLVILSNGKLAIGDMQGIKIEDWSWNKGESLQYLTKHQFDARTLAVLPNNQIASAGDNEGTVIIWDLKSGESLWTLKGHTQFVQTLLVLPNGLLASGSYDGTIRIWDLSSGECLQILTHSYVRALLLLPNNQLASGSDQEIKVWNLNNGQCLKTLTGSYLTMRLLGKTHLLSTIGGEIYCWRLDKWRCEQRYVGLTGGGHISDLQPLSSTDIIATSGCEIGRVSFAPMATLRQALTEPKQALTTTGHYSFFKSLAPDKLKRAPKALMENKSSVNALVLLPNGLLASGADDGAIKVWNLNGEKCINTFSTEHNEKPINALIMLPNGQLASVSGKDYYPAGNIKLWDIASGKCVRSFKSQGHTQCVNTLILLPNGQLASSSNDKTIKLWDFTLGQCVNTLTGHTHSVKALAVLPNNQLASGSDDNTIKIWDLNSGKCLQTLKDDINGIKTLLGLPNGMLAAAVNGIVKIWDLSNCQCVQTLVAQDRISALSLLPNGQLATGSDNGNINTWELSSGKCLNTLTGAAGRINTLALLPNGQLASGSYDGAIRVWDLNLKLTLEELEQKAPECKMM